MSQRKRAQFGLASALGIMVLTVGVLFAGAKSGLERNGKASITPISQSPVGDVSIASMHQK